MACIARRIRIFGFVTVTVITSIGLLLFERVSENKAKTQLCARWYAFALLINVSMRRMRSSNDRVCIPGRKVGERLGEKLIMGRLASTGLLRRGMFMNSHPD